MKRQVVLFCFCAIALLARAQFDPQIGHYMYMPTAYNPAVAGDGDLMRVSGLHRMQFTGIEGAPMSTYFTFSAPFMIGKTRHAAGVRFLNDKYGLWSNQAFYGQYAYRQRLGKGTLGIGVELGLVNIAFSGDSVNLDDLGDSEYHSPTDDAIPQSKVSGMGFDMGAGVYYSTSRWWAGVSYTHITQPKVELSGQQSAEGSENSMRVRGTMYAQGGYKFKLKGRNVALIPSALLETDFRSWDIDLALMTEIKERYRVGLNYRIAGSVGILLGAEIISGLQIGYNYELPTSKLLLESYGSHEVFLAYGLDILRPKRTNKYKSIRYL